jgi:hypothetical protein
MRTGILTGVLATSLTVFSATAAHAYSQCLWFASSPGNTAAWLYQTSCGPGSPYANVVPTQVKHKIAAGHQVGWVECLDSSCQTARRVISDYQRTQRVAPMHLHTGKL